MTASMVAIVASALYTGAAWYITFVEHPAQLACPTKIAREQWEHSVSKSPRYAAVSLLGVVAGFVQGHFAFTSLWTYGSLTLLAVLPFTTIAILPGQRLLAQSAEARDPAVVRSLLERWGRRHAVRTALGATATALFVVAAVSSRA
jgi:hypothetical protein